jgi:hypothetical protein
MAKTAKKKSMKKAVAAALKATENMVFETANLDSQIEQIKEMLKPNVLGFGIGQIRQAGRYPTGDGFVGIQIGSTTWSSLWPEWAYLIAEGALHFNKQVLVMYNDQPFGDNLVLVVCLS